LLRTVFFQIAKKSLKLFPFTKMGIRLNLQTTGQFLYYHACQKFLKKKQFTNVLYVDFLKLNEILFPAQFGFRDNHSTIHAILDVVTHCHENINQRLMIELLMLDLRKRFDTVQHDILITELEHYGIRRLVNRFFQSYLNKQQQYLTINYYKRS